MANNRLYLRHFISGEKFCLCKRMGYEWYHTGTRASFGLRFENFLLNCGTGDDFELLIEDNTEAPDMKEGNMCNEKED